MKNHEAFVDPSWNNERWCNSELVLLKSTIGEVVRSVGLEAHVQSRIKTVESIREKMRRRGLRFNEVHDRLGLRVFVATRAGCYDIWGAIRTSWPGTCHRFRDYIAHPKPNGYQSIHFCLNGDSFPVCEVQVRTWHMHFVSEFGTAAHRRYKDLVIPASLAQKVS